MTVHPRLRRNAMLGSLVLLLGGVGVAPAMAAAPVSSAMAVPTAVAVAGVPDPATVIYDENFQNAPATGATRVANYVSTSGATYTASAVYTNASLCNGVIFGHQATNAALGAVSFCTSSWWPTARTIPAGMGLYRGMADPNQNLAVAEQTIGGGPSYLGVMLEGTNIPTGAAPGAGRYLTFSLDVGNLCTANAQALDRFSLLDGASTIALNTTDYNLCTDPTRQTFTVDGRSITVATFTGNQAALVTSPTVGFRITNQQASGSGNDQAFDNFRILDATPQLDKSFGAMNPVTGESRLTFTVTNTAELGVKAGWSASDNLPAGLVVSSTPDPATTCVNASLTAPSGAGTVSFAGDLAGTIAQRTSCTFAVDVVPATTTAQGGAPQTFQNCASNFGASVGLDLPAACAVVSFPAVAQLAISKSSSASTNVAEGDVITYSITATNTGGADYTATVPASVTDDLSGVLDDADYNADASASLPGAPSYTAPVLGWSGTLPAGTSVTITYSVTVTLAGDGLIENAACVPAAEASSDACATVSTQVAIAPSIGLVKSVSPSAPADFIVGNAVIYSFVVTNTGNLVLNNPAVSEVSFDGTGTTPVIACPATPSLAPGSQMTCTAPYTIVQDDVDNHSLADPLVNEAVASATASNSAQVESETASAQLPAVQTPAVTLAKSARDGSFTQAGQIVTYDFLITNAGNVTLTDASVAETAFDGSGVVSPITCPAAATSLTPGAQVTCTATYALTQADVDRGTVSNEAVASAQPPLGERIESPADDAAVTIIQSPSIVLTKTAGPGGFTEAGQVVHYNFDVLNSGNMTLSGVAIDELSFSGTGTLGEPVCAPSTIAPGESASCGIDYALTQADVDTGIVENSATAVAGDPNDEAVVSAVSSALVTVNPVSSIALEKTVDASVVAGAGVAVTYTFRVTNTGQATVHALTITELDFTGSGVLGAIDCPTVALAPDAIADCTAQYRTTAADVTAGLVENTAVAVATAPGGQPVQSDPSNATVTVNALAAALASTGATIRFGLVAWAIGLLGLGLALGATRLARRRSAA
ncbi:MAG: hypothetical protein ABJB03_06995 [Rhodoglobus sp.]